LQLAVHPPAYGLKAELQHSLSPLNLAAMGKKTTAFINDINKQIADLREPLVNLIGVADAMADKRREHGELMEKIQEVTDKYMPSNKQADNRSSQKENPEAKLAADPEFKKLDAAMGKVNKELETLFDWKDDLKGQLKKGRGDLDDSLKTFEAFVKKKKGAWFGSKKSVPDAEKLIKDGKDASKTIKEVVNKIG
jgi:ABC-type transporter Mla subunit MlaD